MATISNTKTATGNTRSIVVNWSGMANGDDGEPILFSQYVDKSVQVVGTFGVGGSLRLEGTNNGTDWAVLTDPQGNDLNIMTAKIEQIMEACWKVRPRVTAGDGTTSLAVHLMIKE